MFIIYVCLILITTFFLLFSYYSELTLQEKSQYDKLSAIVNTLAIEVDGDLHAELYEKYKTEKEGAIIAQDDAYRTLNKLLRRAAKENELNSPIYTLVYEPSNNTFKYVVRSDDFIDFNNTYSNPPEALFKNLKRGGVIPKYNSENGEWISAFHPIKNKQGNVVGILEADIEFTKFNKEVWSHFVEKAVIVVLVILFLVVFLLFYARKILNEDYQQKVLLAYQKRTIEMKNKDIMDSIRYALKIQNAMLPSEKEFKHCFQDGFVLHLPKDVVAGDFYWMERRGDVIYFAVADCTGHGVPGSILTIICSNALNNTIHENPNADTGEILDEVRKKVIHFLTKGGQDINDGMDIALCKLNLKTHELSFAGAYNPLYIISNNSLKILPGNKQPVGRFVVQAPFDSHHVKLNKNDCIYLFTDGYADQFGGPKQKKFKYNQLRELLLDLASDEMELQKDMLLDVFNIWKGDLEQIDDVCIMGIRI
ncbi:hypothetical protein DNU06_00565 [Putridiphycobacter roseus]|uniref:PPM-type phosphatase domain-containing protein n=1 Tax=Putridiphycobacter roseus TaxID=2219161 RepID=A0A2W1N5G1_9FLAO|nr:SpoIIE family protein phosphatase [Putridiphycobacter roseus]PZE18361.1 hypothetical protein DNU06_00565 [Putridiphycobacter roseus]